MKHLLEPHGGAELKEDFGFGTFHRAAAEPEACRPSEVRAAQHGLCLPQRKDSCGESFFHFPDLKPNFSCPPPASMAAGPDAYLQGSIRMNLEDPELWKTFHEIGTEMIITKPGR